MAGKTNEQIEKIKQYFKGLTVAEGNFYLLVALPKGWKVIDGDSLISNLGVYTAIKPEGTYFMTEMENGTDCLFSAVDEVIEMNKEIEERQQLLQVRAKELADLFITEPLERLKTLEFTFKTATKPIKKKTTKKDTEIKKVIEGPKPKIDELISEESKEIAKTVGPKKEKDNKKEKKEEKQENKDSDTMSFIKNLIEK